MSLGGVNRDESSSWVRGVSDVPSVSSPASVKEKLEKLLTLLEKLVANGFPCDPALVSELKKLNINELKKEVMALLPKEISSVIQDKICDALNGLEITIDRLSKPPPSPADCETLILDMSLFKCGIELLSHPELNRKGMAFYTYVRLIYCTREFAVIKDHCPPDFFKEVFSDLFLVVVGLDADRIAPDHKITDTLRQELIDCIASIVNDPGDKFSALLRGANQIMDMLTHRLTPPLPKI